MKIPSGLLLLFLALTLSVQAEEAIPAKTSPAAVKRELVWPEIKDPQALIDFAKAEIKCVGDNGKKWGFIDLSKKPEIANLHSSDCFVSPEYLIIYLDTHPLTGQALLVLPPPNTLQEREKRWVAKIEDTSTPGIKRVLARLSSDPSWSIYQGYEHSTVRWRNIQNLSKDKNTWPIPLEFRLPVYPELPQTQGVSGEANVDFTVTESGSISDLSIKATYPEFESVVREVAQYWRFEPGVDSKTRLPAATRMSLTVKFMIDGD
jgi:TonB family protein